MEPLAGKSPAAKEKILRARAKKGIPLPEGTTPSEKKLIDKVRADLGLPKEPDTKSMRAKHEQAAKAGLLEPLEGKTPAQKEALLKGLRDMGIPLPEGRTPSEKALISKLTWKPRSLVSPSEQLRRAKAEGLMTPLAGKTPAQKEKILKGLAMKGIPLPEAKTPSEKKLMEKVREDLGLPKEPDTKSMKDKYEQAAKAGVLQPLVGKTPEEKEKILQGLHDLGIPLPEGRTPSEKALVAKVKALPPGGSIKSAGLMTPLAGKPPPVKEKILRARAKKGIPLPEGTTPSEKKLIDKVRADLGLPKEPDTKSMKAKHEQAAKAGLLEPLEGKTPAQKEAQLKGLRDMGIPLPEGRTPSEKALIAKVKGAPRSMVSPSEQLRRAKAEGLMTPLAGKTPAQKEKILKGLAMKGIPLPEGKTPSEKKLIDKVREDLGLPKEPDTKSLKDKYEKAAKAGLLQPLVGKTPEEKEKILQGQYDLGIPLPEGRTPSEKALIDKIKAVPAGSIKTAGVMEPLAGKSPTAKEKILRARAKKGIPLPEGTTPSEKKLIDKVRADLGLPKEPDTRSMKAKHEQAAKVGLLEPLEGKTPAQKEAQLKGLRDMGIPLPEGRTPSEKALIAKIKAAPRSMVSPSEQLRRAKAEGLMTPLAGKTPAQKEKILKGLAMKGIPLPEGKSPSEKQLIDKVRDDLGLPKEPDTKSLKDKYDQAAKAGFLQPLAGKTPEEKEKILQGQHNLGIPLPEGRTPSEKALIAKIKAAPRAAVAPSEQLRRAKAEGLLTPLKGKKPEQKEKIIKGLAMKGLPLPIPKTPSEKKLVNKIRAELGLPKEPTTKEERDQHEKAAKAGLLRPLEGMTPDEKEKTLKGLAELGIPLPEGRTPSEKSLIAKVKATTKKKESVPSITTEKIKQAKKAGLFTPLKGKTHDQKEKILRGLAEAGLPLPPPKTASEKKLVKELKEEFGIPDRTPSEKLRRAKEHGLLTPLAGKSRPQKEKILRGRAAAGFPLPKDGTPSEKALIKKIKAETGYVSPSQAEKAKRAKAAGLMTPLEGKSPEEQEKILKGLAELGLPLPEGTTPSEKSVIAKFKARIPPEAKTPSEKSIIRKAKAAGLFTPIAGKSPEEQEKILKGLADAGLPLPEGKTDSEKSLIKKIRAQAGLPPEPTPSEKKGGIRKKGKMVGVSASKKEKETGKELGKGIEGEEIEEIVKTTKCDRACGCTRKKIKFKHSYVKIRVTSPDISSFCDCPDECLPGVKAGAFVDNDGIKVTIGSAVGIPSYSMMCINEGIPDKMVTNIDLSKAQTNYYDNVDVLKNSKYKFSSFESGLNNNGNKGNVNINISSSDISYNTKLYNTHSDNNCVYSRIPHNKGRTSKFENIMESFKDLQSMEYIYKKPMSETKSSSSFETILIIRNDMSLSTSTSNSTGSISLTSNMRSSISSSSAQYSGYQSTNDLLSINSLDGPTTSDDYIDHPTIRQRNALRNIGVAIPQQYTILRMTQLEHKFGNNKMREKDLETKDPIVLLNRSPSKLGVSKIMLKIMARKCFDGASAMFIVVPMSEDEEEQEFTKGVDSMTSVRSSERHFTANTTSVVVPDSPRPALRTEVGARVCGKGKKFYLQEISSSTDSETMFQNEPDPAQYRVEMMKDDFCQVSRPNEIVGKLEKQAQAVGSNVTVGRPCSKQHNAANATSRQMTPLFFKGKSVSWFHCKKSTKSSEYTMTMTQSFESSCSPVPTRRRCLHECSQTAKSPSLSVCSPVDLNGKRNQQAKVQIPSVESTHHDGGTVPKTTGVAWFRSDLHKASVSSSLPECNIPVCTDLCSYFRDHGRNQQLQTPASTASWVCLADLKGTRNPSAKVGKSWFRLQGMRNASAACDIPPSCDHRFCPVPPIYSHRRGRGRGDQQTRSKKKPLNNLKVIGKPSAKVGKGISWFRFPSSCELATPADSPTCDSSVFCRHKPPAQRNLCFKDPKPSAQIIDSETIPKLSGFLKWLSWTRISKLKKSAPSIPTCGVSQYFGSSSSPLLLDQARHHGRNQQNEAGTSPPPCVSSLAEWTIKRNRSAKVQKPSIQSAFQEGTWQGVNLNGPCLATKHTSVPSIMMRGVPMYIDSTCSPMPPSQTHEQSRSSAAPSLCANDRKVKKNRSGVSLSWSRIPWLCLPSKRKTSAPSIKTCDVHVYVDSSCSPHLLHYGCDELSQTSAITFLSYPPDDWRRNRNPTAKVQKPSIESIYHEGETTSNLTGVTMSWCRLPRKRNTNVPAITCGGVQRRLHRHGHNKKTQTPKPLPGYPSNGLEVMRNPPAIVHKPCRETVRREDGTAPKKTGVASGWFRLPSIRKASLKLLNKYKHMENFIGSKQKSNTLNLSVSKSEPGGPPISEQLIQLQQMSAITQKYSQEVCCLFRKQNPKLQLELAKEIVEIPEFKDQQSEDSIKQTTPPPLKQQLTSIKTIEHKGYTSMGPKEMKNPKCHRYTKTERQCKGNKRKSNTVTLSDSESKTHNLIMPQIEKKEFRTKCRRCPEQDQTPQLVLAKEIDKLPNAINQVKLIKQMSPEPLRLANTKTVEQTDGKVEYECKKDKLMSSKYQDSPKTSKQKKKEVLCEYKEDNPMSIKYLEHSKTSKLKQEVTEQLPNPRWSRFPPQLPLSILGLPPAETPDGYFYESIGPSHKWLDTGKTMKFRSEPTQSTSGFKSCKRKKIQKYQVDNEIELDFADLIRYFASINPGRFQQLMQEELESQFKAEEDKRKYEKKIEKQMEKVRKKSEKEAKKGKKDKTTTTEEVPISDVSDESDYAQGFKFSFAVKNARTGLTGVDYSKD